MSKTITRFWQVGQVVQAQLISQKSVRGKTVELPTSAKIVAGKILELKAGFVAHVKTARGFAKVGTFEEEGDAMEKIVEVFDFKTATTRIMRPG